MRDARRGPSGTVEVQWSGYTGSRSNVGLWDAQVAKVEYCLPQPLRLFDCPIDVVRLTKISSVNVTPLAFFAVLPFAPPSPGSRKGLFDVGGKGNCGCVASALRGEGEVALKRLRKGLLEEKASVGDVLRSPLPVAVRQYCKSRGSPHLKQEVCVPGTVTAGRAIFARCTTLDVQCLLCIQC